LGFNQCPEVRFAGRSGMAPPQRTAVARRGSLVSWYTPRRPRLGGSGYVFLRFIGMSRWGLLHDTPRSLIPGVALFNFVPETSPDLTGFGSKLVRGQLPSAGAHQIGRDVLPVPGRAPTPRFDGLLRMLAPAVPFRVAGPSKMRGYSVIWPHSHADVLFLLLAATPLVGQSIFFDMLLFYRLGIGLLHYVFKLVIFRAWLSVTTPPVLGAKLSSSSRIFKFAAWAERELAELSGGADFVGGTNRRLLTDYFSKNHPLMPWVPSVGFTELSLSPEGFFLNRPVRVLNGTSS